MYKRQEQPDILCLQETKCTPDQVEQLWPASYTTFWNSAEKKGYSGTAIFTKERPLKVTPHLGIAEHDNEGRVPVSYTHLDVYKRQRAGGAKC